MILSGDKAVFKNIVDNSRQRLIPIRIFFELTYACNLKCKHCIVSEDKGRKEMTYEEICRVIDQIAEFGCMFVNFTGGEPLVRKEFFEIVGYARKKGIGFTIQTNGTLITPEIADKIASFSPLHVSVTLLGANKDTHDGIVGVRGAYKRTVAAIKLLRRRKVHVYVATVIMKHNANELPKIWEFAQQESASWAISPQIIPKFNGSQEPILCRALNEQIKDSITRYSTMEIGKGLMPKILNSPLCNAGGSSTTVTAYGDLNPCPGWMRNKSRNLLGGRTVSEIWNKDSDFRQIKNLKKKDIPKCRNCNLLLYCSLCPVLNFFEKGDILVPSEESCRRARLKKEALEERSLQNEKKKQRYQN